MQSATVAAGVVDHLRERIVSGVLQPGMALPPERELASQLAVSRPALREGLSILAQMGLVTIQRGRGGGAVVTAPPATTVANSIALLFQTRVVTAAQFTEYRRAIEVEAAQLAASRRTAHDLEAIATALAAYAAPNLDTAAQNLHGRAFHHAVARASGNPLLAETMASLNDAFAACLTLLHDTPDAPDLIHDLHWPIFDAIRRQDVVDARRAMRVHFAQLAQALADLGLGERPIGTSPSSVTVQRESAEHAPRAGRG